MQGQAAGAGRFPTRHDTVRAEVLADLLGGSELTPMSAVRSSSTTRLADAIFALRGMGWSIETGELTVPTKDGRIANVAAYKMPTGVIASAMTAGAAEFCASVRDARFARRADSLQ
jgi:hypothetical protein